DSVHGKKSGLANAAVDLTQPDQIKDVWTPDTKMVWLETPTNPMLSVFDIKAISDLVHELGGIVVVDNT
ncbi:MAG: PLP-dependent transferase, partial [Acidimicrobiales bacterium]